MEAKRSFTAPINCTAFASSIGRLLNAAAWSIAQVVSSPAGPQQSTAAREPSLVLPCYAESAP